MASNVNVRKTYTGTGAQPAIQLNRWSRDNYSSIVSLDTTGTYTIEGTLDYVNRPLDADFQDGPTPVWFDITSLVGLVADSAEKITDTPLEAIRMNIAANATGIDWHVMQNGEG